MSLPLSWIDRIFERLTLTYGQEFLARWRDIDLNAVKTDWLHELSRFEHWPEAIAFALEHLPDGKPPTVLQFRNICLQAPAKAVPQLPAPQANPDRMKAEIAKLKESMSVKPASKVRDREWAKRILNQVEAVEKKSPAVVAMAKRGLAN